MIELLMTAANNSSNQINALIFDDDNSANAHMTLEAPDDTRTIFESWPRASDRTFFLDPSTATGVAANWNYDNDMQAFYHPSNTASTEMIVSPYKVDDFSIESVLTSYDRDDDAVGLIIGFQEDKENNSIRFLAAWVHTGGLNNPQWTLRYGDWENAESSGHFRNMGEIVASNDEILERRTTSQGDGWIGPPRFEIRVKVEKVGNTVTAWCSNFSDSSTLLDESELSVDLENLPRDGHKLTSDIRVGFAVNSQRNAYFLETIIRSPVLIGDTDVYSAESGNKWIFDEETTSWLLDDVTVHDEFDSMTVIRNILTNQQFIARNNGTIDLVSDKGIKGDTVTINMSDNTADNIPSSDIISNFNYEKPLYITHTMLSDGVSVQLLDNELTINSGDSGGSFMIRLSDLETPETIAYKKVKIMV